MVTSRSNFLVTSHCNLHHPGYICRAGPSVGTSYHRNGPDWLEKWGNGFVYIPHVLQSSLTAAARTPVPPDAPRMPPPLHRSSNCVVCDCSSEIEPVSLHTAAAYHLEPPEPAPATPIRVDNSHSEKTVWRRPPVVSQTVFASVHVYRRKTHARTGARDFSTCIRDRMQRQIGACRAHQTPPRRI